MKGITLEFKLEEKTRTRIPIITRHGIMSTPTAESLLKVITQASLDGFLTTASLETCLNSFSDVETNIYNQIKNGQMQVGNPVDLGGVIVTPQIFNKQLIFLYEVHPSIVTKFKTDYGF